MPMASASYSLTSLASSKLKNLCLHNGLILRVLKDLLQSLIEKQVCIGPSNGRTRDGGRGNNQGRAILHDLGKGNERIIDRHDRRSSRRGALSLGHPCKSNSLLRSRDLDKSRGRFPNDNPLSLGTLLNRTRLRWKD